MPVLDLTPPNPITRVETHICEREHLDDFRALESVSCEALLQRRRLPRHIQDLLKQTAVEALPEFQFRGMREALEQRLDTALHANSVSAPSQLLDWLKQDISQLATAMCGMHAADRVQVKLEVITDDACRKFHIDNVLTRLICTYYGPGTQCTALDGPYQTDDILDIPTGMPLVLKGRRWPKTPPQFLHHRSPPIEQRGLHRLILVIEPILTEAASGEDVALMRPI